MIERIAILGTGLLGTSVGLALRTAGFKGSIIGWNRGVEGGEAALAAGAVDTLAADPIEAARAAQITVLATPIFSILDFMEKLSTVLGPEQMITDVGSTKGEITTAGQQLYNQPGRAAFLPGHPMAGKERGGADLGEAALFRGAVWLFTDAELVERSATAKMLVADWRAWVAAMGSRTLDLDAERHDEIVAWVSHLPQFLSTALSALLEEKIGAAPELKQVGGRALREMTRLGSSPFSMWRDIAMTNTAAVDQALQMLEQRIQHLRENLRSPELRAEFEQANRFRKD
jgi:prephenate dehydrogenase